MITISKDQQYSNASLLGLVYFFQVYQNTNETIDQVVNETIYNIYQTKINHLDHVLSYLHNKSLQDEQTFDNYLYIAQAYQQIGQVEYGVKLLVNRVKQYLNQQTTFTQLIDIATFIKKYDLQQYEIIREQIASYFPLAYQFFDEEKQQQHREQFNYIV